MLLLMLMRSGCCPISVCAQAIAHVLYVLEQFELGKNYVICARSHFVVVFVVVVAACHRLVVDSKPINNISSSPSSALRSLIVRVCIQRKTCWLEWSLCQRESWPLDTLCLALSRPRIKSRANWQRRRRHNCFVFRPVMIPAHHHHHRFNNNKNNDADDNTNETFTIRPHPKT